MFEIPELTKGTMITVGDKHYMIVSHKVNANDTHESTVVFREVGKIQKELHELQQQLKYAVHDMSSCYISWAQAQILIEILEEVKVNGHKIEEPESPANSDIAEGCGDCSNEGVAEAFPQRLCTLDITQCEYSDNCPKTFNECRTKKKFTGIFPKLPNRAFGRYKK
jgi:hypothetical protein